MARLARRSTTGRCRVSVRGYLGAADLRRLERACAPALEYNPAPLDLEVDALSGIDESAREFILCLLHRGTTLVGRRASEWEHAIVHGPAPLPPVQH